MVQSRHSKAAIAAAELARRGTVTPRVEVSGHAIDSASLRLRWYWHETAKDASEGIHAWLCRICGEALDKSQPDADGVLYFGKMKMVFEPGEWPVLKTVMPLRKGSTGGFLFVDGNPLEEPEQVGGDGLPGPNSQGF